MARVRHVNCHFEGGRSDGIATSTIAWLVSTSWRWTTLTVDKDRLVPGFVIIIIVCSSADDVARWESDT